MTPETIVADLTIFANRCTAGRQLAGRLAEYRGRDVVVVGLPRGGVPVAYEVAHALEAPLGVLAVRKIAAPGRPALVIGTVAPGVAHLDEEIVALLDLPQQLVDGMIAHERNAAERLHRSLLDDRPPVDMRGKTTLIVDDGIVTGATALAAVEVARREGAARVVVAVPVCAADAQPRVAARADELVCLERPEQFRELSSWYADFTPPTRAEVRALLKMARLEREAGFRYLRSE